VFCITFLGDARAGLSELPSQTIDGFLWKFITGYTFSYVSEIQSVSELQRIRLEDLSDSFGFIAQVLRDKLR
jgi:hypothetical protein